MTLHYYVSVHAYDVCSLYRYRLKNLSRTLYIYVLQNGNSRFQPYMGAILCCAILLSHLKSWWLHNRPVSWFPSRNVVCTYAQTDHEFIVFVTAHCSA